MGKLVEAVDHRALAPIRGASLDEVEGQEVLAMLGPQPNAGAVREPQPPALGLLLGHFEPLAAPDPLEPLVVHKPARIAQKSGDLAVAVAAILASEFDQVGGELLFVVSAPRRFALCRAVLAERPAGAALGDLQHGPDMLNTGAPTRRAQ